MKETFVDRLKEIALLDRCGESFLRGVKIPFAVIGLRRIGKTELLLRFKKRNKRKFLIPYVNMQQANASPDVFLEEVLISLFKEIGESQGENWIFGGSKREQILSASAVLGETYHFQALKYLRTLETGNYTDMIETSFLAPEELGKLYGKKVIFILDEFQDVLELQHFRIKPLGIIRSVVEKQKNVLYIVSGSLISFMEKIITDKSLPFFNQFQILRLGMFNKQDTIKFVKLLLGEDVEKNVLEEIYQYTLGHPFYTRSICERLLLESITHKMDRNLVKYAVVKETLDKDGKINILFRYIYEESLERVRRRGHLKRILRLLAETEGMNLTEISRGLRKPTGQINNYMKGLLNTDIVFQKEGRYYFRDKLFRYWVAKTELGKDIAVFHETYHELISELMEKYLRVSTELGIAKEYEIREKLSKLLNMKLSSYTTPDGQIEFDIYGKIGNREVVGEIKWRNRQVDVKLLQKFVEKAKVLFDDAELYYVSKEGFTSEAKEYATSKNVRMLQEEDL